MQGADFTIYTDHKPLRSLFYNENKNSKIQRWSVILAEHGAKIEYRKGKFNTRADMLSRIRPKEDLKENEQKWYTSDEELMENVHEICSV